MRLEINLRLHYLLTTFPSVVSTTSPLKSALMTYWLYSTKNFLLVGLEHTHMHFEHIQLALLYQACTVYYTASFLSSHNFTCFIYVSKSHQISFKLSFNDMTVFKYFIITDFIIFIVFFVCSPNVYTQIYILHHIPLAE